MKNQSPIFLTNSIKDTSIDCINKSTRVKLIEYNNEFGKGEGVKILLSRICNRDSVIVRGSRKIDLKTSTVYFVPQIESLNFPHWKFDTMKEACCKARELFNFYVDYEQRD